MTQNIGGFDRFVRFFLAAVAIFAALVLFESPILVGLALVFGVFAFWEGAAGKCPLYKHLGVAKPGETVSSEALYLLGLHAIQIVIAYEWLSAGWGKISSGEFPSGLAATLGKFAAENPFAWYKSFLEQFAIPNATAFGFAVEWSQLLIGIVLVAAVLVSMYAKNTRLIRSALCFSAVALLGGMLMNANFYLAAGWMSPSTHSVNLIMFWVQAILLFVKLDVLRRK